jgi:hypothetical protein
MRVSIYYIPHFAIQTDMTDAGVRAHLMVQGVFVRRSRAGLDAAEIRNFDDVGRELSRSYFEQANGATALALFEWCMHERAPLNNKTSGSAAMATRLADEGFSKIWIKPFVDVDGDSSDQPIHLEKRAAWAVQIKEVFHGIFAAKIPEIPTASVMVFDSSGISPASGRFKVSFRVVIDGVRTTAAYLKRTLRSDNTLCNLRHELGWAADAGGKKLGNYDDSVYGSNGKIRPAFCRKGSVLQNGKWVQDNRVFLPTCHRPGL